ncbi:hypothetical protein RI367_002374 [Sorochytrium milnesiophthora]
MASDKTPPTSPRSTAHLLVCTHGLYGNSSHMERLVNQFSDTFPDLLILNASSYPLGMTFDGVDVCAEKLLDEVKRFIQAKKTESGVKITKISFLGYSLGGLIVRYAAGRLYSDGFFAHVKPMNLVTMATPHLGVSGRYRPQVILARTLLFRSGKQCSITDRETEYGNLPLLWAMADPRLPFHAALLRFEKVIIVANVVGDRTVPYLTASIQLKSPYVDTRSGSPHMVVDQNNKAVVVPRDNSHPPVVPLTGSQRFQQTLLRTIKQLLVTVLLIVLILPLVLLIWLFFIGPAAAYENHRAHKRTRAGYAFLQDGRAPLPAGVRADPDLADAQEKRSPDLDENADLLRPLTTVRTKEDADNPNADLVLSPPALANEPDQGNVTSVEINHQRAADQVKGADGEDEDDHLYRRLAAFQQKLIKAIRSSPDERDALASSADVSTYQRWMCDALQQADLTRIDVWLGEFTHTHAAVVGRTKRLEAKGKDAIRAVTEKFIV